jgi:glycerophosphoryl diester phosphodiesterase
MTLVIAHRGASWEEPENTLAAFRRAIELGADYVELDVHAAPDGSLRVVHDRPDGRTDAPSLEDALATVDGRAGVMVDLKNAYRYRGHDFLRRVLALLGDDALLAAFEPRVLEEAHRQRSRIRIVQHVENVPLARAARYAWAASFWDTRATAASFARARRLGLETLVYTVNEPERMRELAALGATAIVSDRPDLLRRTLACI